MTTYKEVVDRLIEVIKEFPQIYDPRHPAHRDAAYVEKSWKSVAAALGMSVAEAKRTWQSLRDGFTRYRRRRYEVSRMSGTNVKMPKAPVYAEAMEYFSKYMGVRRRAGSNLYDKQPPDYPVSEGHSQHILIVSSENPETIHGDHSLSASSTSSATMAHEMSDKSNTEQQEMEVMTIPQNLTHDNGELLENNGNGGVSSSSGLPLWLGEMPPLMQKNKKVKKKPAHHGMKKAILDHLLEGGACDMQESFGLYVASALRSLSLQLEIEARTKINIILQELQAKALSG